MLSSQNIHSVSVFMDYDPAADDQMPVFVASDVCTIVSAKATTANAVAGSGTNYFTVGLVNKGTAGTGTVEISPTDVGGTVGWSALVPKSFTVGTANSQLASGEVVVLDYDEEATGSFAAMTVQIDYVMGQGA